jgi:hypothetical protein
MRPKLLVPVVLAAPFAATLLASESEARPSYLAVWESLYPGSLSLDNVSAAASCQLCHTNPSGNDPWNGYGWDIREFMQSGSAIDVAIQLSEGLNSDADPTGATNLEEILADTQPGWTDGPHNTTYFENGGTLTNQDPPPGILGSLDPSGGPSLTLACDPASNHSGGTYAKLDASDASGPGVWHLECTDGPVGEFGYFLVSSTLIDPGLPVSAGFLCLGAPIGRYAPAAGGTLSSIGQFGAGGVLNNLAGTSSSGTGYDVLGALPSPPGGTIAAGDTWYFQCWYRDGQASNFSNVAGVTF